MSEDVHNITKIDNSFDNWNELKKDLHFKGKRKYFKQGEIYFMSIGQNIGYEIIGKKKNFLRPVLIFRKFNKDTFLGIPLTSKQKNGSYFFEFSYKKDKISTALITQMRVFDSKRIVYYSGKINKEIFSKLENRVAEVLKLTPQNEGGYTCQKDKQRNNIEIIPKNNKEVNENLKVSIITVVYNNKDTIKDAIESVLNQTYKNIEYIIIDGASSDGTIEIIKSYGNKIDKFISEPDNGIYDAMNKGIKLASGDIVGILNSDDFYVSNDIIQDVADVFLEQKVDSVYGDLVYVDSKNTNKIVRYWKSKEYKKGLFQKGWHPAHPTFFVKREVYQKYGLFNLDFKIAADYELMLRFLEKYNISSTYISKVFVKMRVGGESNQSIKNIIKANIESYKAWKVNGLYINPLMFLLKPLSKLKQFLE